MITSLRQKTKTKTVAYKKNRKINAVKSAIFMYFVGAMRLLQEMQGINLIDSYSSSGFRLNDNSFLIGPSIIFPTAVFRNIEFSLYLY